MLHEIEYNQEGVQHSINSSLVVKGDDSLRTAMAKTVGFAILGALILSLTYIPMMCALFLPKQLSRKKTFSDQLMEKLQQMICRGWVYPCPNVHNIVCRATARVAQSPKPSQSLFLINFVFFLLHFQPQSADCNSILQ